MADADVMQQLKAMQDQMNAMTRGAQPGAVGAPVTMSPPVAAPWGAPATMAPQPGFAGMPGMTPAQPTGLLVAISVPTPQGEVTCHLQFGQEAAANPQAVIMSLMQQGWPVKAYQRNGGNFGGGGGGFNRGGGFRRGGGW